MSEFEKREVVPHSDIVVTESIVLPPGRNFYDQFPFRDVFGNAVRQFKKQTPAKERNTFLDIASMVTRSVESADETDQRNTAGFDRNTYIRTLLTRPSRIRDALMTAE